MPILTIPAGATDTGVVPGDFAVIQYVSWNTTWFPSLKDGTDFTLQFGTPAGPGDQTVSYLAAFTPPPPATGQVTLADYLAEVRRLLHDADGDYWTDAELIIDINKAIRQRDMWSGGSRSLQSAVALTTGVDQYLFADVFPSLTVLDVINIWLIYGQTRVALANPPFTELTNYFRQMVNFRNVPGAWARYGGNSVYIATRPSTAWTTDWDLVTLSTTLAHLGDVDPLIFPYTEPVPYYAANLACINARRWDLADRFMGFFLKAMRDIEGSRVGEMPMMVGNSGSR